jgi:sec-independent protein translocase protein TatB
MLFNLGGYEILVIAVAALIFVGPEQLPSVVRKVGRYAAQLRTMATGMRDEFMAGMDGMDGGLEDLRNLTKPENWLGTGTSDDPVVPRGYAERQRANRPGLGPAGTQAPGTQAPGTQDAGTPDPGTQDAGTHEAPATTEPARPAPFSQRSSAGAWQRGPASPAGEGETGHEAGPDAGDGPARDVPDRNGDRP